MKSEKRQSDIIKYGIRAAIIICILFFLLTCVSCAAKTGPEASRNEIQKEQGIPVEVVTVKKGDILITVDVSGQLNADEKLTLNTNNTGTITELTVKEGDEVKAGQLVAVIEPNDIEDQITQGQAAVNSAYLKLTQTQSQALLQITQVEGAIKEAEEALKGAQSLYNQAQSGLLTAKEQQSIVEEGSRKQDIAVAEESVNQVQASFRQAKVDLGRMQRLFDKGAISKQQLDTAQVQYDVAEAQYNSAVHKLDLTKEGSRIQEKETAKQQVQIAEEKVTAAQAAVDQAKEALKVAQNNRLQITVAQQEVDVAQAVVEQAKASLAIITRKLEKAYVKSPINGYVTQRYVDLGQYAGGQGPSKIADIFNPKTLYFEAIVSDTDIGKINPGLETDIKIDGIPDKTFKGYVKEIIPIAAQESRQFSVKILFNTVTTELRPGMFARGRILLAEHKNVPILLSDAIKENEGKNYVYTVDNMHAGEKEIVTGPVMGGNIEIMQGLKPGEKVIYSGTVKKGDLLKIIREE